MWCFYFAIKQRVQVLEKMTTLWNDFSSFSMTLLTTVYLCLITLPVSDGLQCYNCRGITNYDPNECFTPIQGKTVLQECQKGEFCEKRVTMVDRLQEVMDRGCSSNCNNRKFVWTDEFQVYCCSDKDYCNHTTTRYAGNTVLWSCALIMTFLITRTITWWQWPSEI
jgi:hypothetical protein